MDADEDASALVGCGESDGSDRGLSLLESLRRAFEAVINGIADHVDEGIPEFFDDVAVEFGLLPVEQELNLLALLGPDVAHETGHLLEDAADRNHAQGHGVALEFGSCPAELTQAAGQRAAPEGLDVGILNDHGLGDDEFPDEIDEGIELPGLKLHEARGGLGDLFAGDRLGHDGIGLGDGFPRGGRFLNGGHGGDLNGDRS